MLVSQNENFYEGIFSSQNLLEGCSPAAVLDEPSLILGHHPTEI
jgi:hypothetical protein